MDVAIQQIVDRVNATHPRLVAITEPNHYSHSSHRLHTKLMKRLVVENHVDIISSERLGIFDALLINAWLDGRLRGRLADLFRDVLPLGGLGTIPWVRWLKSERREGRYHRLVGFEADYWFHLSRHGPTHRPTIRAVKTLASPQLAGRIHRLDRALDVTPQTEIDREILRALAAAERHYRDRNSRFDIWAENMQRAQGRIFINGFHLARGEEVGPRVRGTQLLIGISSYNRF